ncbi:MAG: copper homeostasis protein CutC [Cyclobacteriaceae bacterium]
MVELEACVESLEEAKLASVHKLKRIELCNGLDVGGLTPSIGLIEACVKLHTIETHVLIRPRPGNFTYASAELDLIKRDIEMSAEKGVKGVVFGVLDEAGFLDFETNSELVQLSKSLGLDATFHRAFDAAGNPRSALNLLIQLGFDRLLTSGQAKTAIEGIEVIRDLVQQADGRIQVMAGSGVNPDNACELVEAGVDALHFSIRKLIRKEELGMGTTYQPDAEKLIGILSTLT